MHLSVLLEMAAEAAPERVAIAAPGANLTFVELLQRSQAAATMFAQRRRPVGLVDENSEAVPIALMGAAFAGVPYVPLNFRFSDRRLAALVRRLGPAIVVHHRSVLARIGDIEGVEWLEREELIGSTASAGAPPTAGQPADPDDVAVQLFTSGTTGEPKAALLRHGHLASYVMSTVEFMAAAPDEATLVSVPAYHVAGITVVLSSVYTGRRIVYLPVFDPEAWVKTAAAERVTHAMVVPTMLGRILDVLERTDERLEGLRHLSYGGGRMPRPVIERALRLLPETDFVNAYGLTETSSTIAVLGPEEHRAALAADDPAVRRRITSVGRPAPSVKVEVRNDHGRVVGAETIGEVWVRGEQVSGEYVGFDARVDGWFPTRDRGFLDEDGYLFLDGRTDDVIVRGGENISPVEVEEVLVAHRDVLDAAVVGVPDMEWGEALTAVVVVARAGIEPDPDELRSWVRAHLRSSRVPTTVEFREELPYSETGKLLRRVLRAELATSA